MGSILQARSMFVFVSLRGMASISARQSLCPCVLLRYGYQFSCLMKKRWHYILTVTRASLSNTQTKYTRDKIWLLNCLIMLANQSYMHGLCAMTKCSVELGAKTNQVEVRMVISGFRKTIRSISDRLSMTSSQTVKWFMEHWWHSYS